MNEPVTSLPLRDIHLPEAISWWPLAPGWWLLLVLLIVVVTLAWWWQRRKVAMRVRVVALVAWQQLMADFQQDQNKHRLVQGLSVLLRRVCLSYYPREDVAGLSGEVWLQYLDARDGSDVNLLFSDGVGRLLIEAPYQQKVEGDIVALHHLCGEWLTALPPLKAVR